MILPIVAYGHSILRSLAKDIDKDFPGLNKLVDDMWQTLYASNGVGLAAPQVNQSIRLFLIDSLQLFNKMDDEEKNEYAGDEGYKGVFFNAKILSLNGKEWVYNEGCLSIPNVREDVYRNQEVSIHFFDENWQLQTKKFTGITARIILHEYDHLEGKLFIDYLVPLKRKLLKRKLTDISKGYAKVDYKMLLP